MSTFNGFLGLGNHLTDGILVEPLAASGYARAAYVVDRVLSGVGVNNAALNWGPATVDWGVMQYWGLFDSNGNQIAAGALTSSVTVTVIGTNLVQCASGGFAVRFGPAWASDLVLTGGQITSADVHITVGAVVLDASYSGLIADAAHFFDLAFANDAKGMVIYALRGSDHIVGSSVSDIINGYAGRDNIVGGSGNDTLTGGKGLDHLTGGLGTDHFVFTDGADTSGPDVITDFSSGSDPAGLDHIDLSHKGFAGLGPLGVMDTSHFSIGSAQSGAAQVIWNPATGVLTFDADGTGNGAAVAFAQIPSNRVVHFFDFDLI